MKNLAVVGVDLSKNVFQLHGAAADGHVVFSKKVSRAGFLKALGKLPTCLVAMEACASSHYWGREVGKLGHEVRLIAPIYVKPFVKRQKNDANDAFAIAEAAARPTMRFVEVKSELQQARSMVFRTREILVRQRTQMINALRAHLAEHGLVVPHGAVHVEKLRQRLEADGGHLPEIVHEMARLYFEQIGEHTQKIKVLEKKLQTLARNSGTAKILQTIPGLGPITAIAIEAFAPAMATFKRGRDFAAWLGLVPKQHSTGGKTRLGKTSKAGQRDIRRLLIIGATTVIWWARKKGAPRHPWLEALLARKAPLVAAVALANKMARTVWAMITKGETYRDPASMAV
ncbi:IS110 family RNA-guided transposase [Flexibacterium corallicola]|uniref:IS110 family transposase n=1 Tax=Flexibacterium corallicola TaxID=3037259 RepID=UPI00286F69B1|nr:IS110 family transposase [Pseudovibrio sp. M1P-2-3]